MLTNVNFKDFTRSAVYCNWKELELCFLLGTGKKMPNNSALGFFTQVDEKITRYFIFMMVTCHIVFRGYKIFHSSKHDFKKLSCAFLI
jgi:hypothetical protein